MSQPPGMGVAFGMSPCYGCGRVFCWHPDRVPSIRIDPRTRKPPAEGDQAAMARSVTEPVCPACCRKANPERAKNGLPLLDERDTMDLLEQDAWGPW